MEETEDGEVALPGANVYRVGNSEKDLFLDANGEFKIKWEKVGGWLLPYWAPVGHDRR